MNFLDGKRKQKLGEVEARKNSFPPEMFIEGIGKAEHAFINALRGRGRVSLIAEFKKASPSLGSINSEADLGEFISIYDEHADCISILTDEKDFSGKPEFIAQAKEITKKPVLRKDFILDEYQIYEARHFGADAVLLIAGFVSLEKLRQLVALADSLGMDCLVECHDEKGLEDCLASGSKLIGLNNRNLNTLEEDFANTFRLLEKIPAEKREGLVIVSESSIRGAREIRKLRGRVDAVLAGTAIMASSVPKAKIRELAGKTLVKVCGITNKEDALEAARLGTDIIGLNFYEKSPRFVETQKAREIAGVVRGKALVAGVFVNMEKEKAGEIAREAGLDLLQFSGDETKEYVSGFKIPVIKAIRVREKEDIAGLEEFDCDYMMIDAFKEGEFGGTGETIDKSLLDKELLEKIPLVFSGGLTPENVNAIIGEFNPVMVDVCSGVEESPGRKSFSKMKAFIHKAKGMPE